MPRFFRGCSVALKLLNDLTSVCRLALFLRWLLHEITFLETGASSSALFCQQAENLFELYWYKISLSEGLWHVRIISVSCLPCTAQHQTQTLHFSLIPGSFWMSDGTRLKRRSKESKAIPTQITIIQLWLHTSSRSTDRGWDALVLLVSVLNSFTGLLLEKRKQISDKR